MTEITVAHDIAFEKACLIAAGIAGSWMGTDLVGVFSFSSLPTMLTGIGRTAERVDAAMHAYGFPLCIEEYLFKTVNVPRQI
ncbi:hypothetical protein PspLS_11879 [Pyricularia sp. CBS 133598]|nr:hypothetical protein PspLS_11879 [Pyricularia sp. CBS 133598]